MTKKQTITFPEMTAKEIVESCDNRTDFGKELLYRAWFKDEKFYTDEKCRPLPIPKIGKIEYAGKSYEEIVKLVGEERIPNFAEVVWMLKTNESFYDLLSYKNGACFTWASSKDDSGDVTLLGGVSDWDSFGPLVGWVDARGSRSILGLGFLLDL